jgi:hypothetical protein
VADAVVVATAVLVANAVLVEVSAQLTEDFSRGVATAPACAEYRLSGLV